jgi:hypothetical protein
MLSDAFINTMLTVVMLSVVRGECRGAIELDMQVRSQKGSKVKQTFYNNEQKIYNSERSNNTFFDLHFTFLT